jgi:hypothetical protein
MPRTSLRDWLVRPILRRYRAPRTNPPDQRHQVARLGAFHRIDARATLGFVGVEYLALSRMPRAF